MIIGEQIKQARKGAALTQAKLGAAVGISTMSIRRYESGEREPDETVLKAILSVTGFDVCAESVSEDILTIRDAIKEDLLDQLARNGTVGKYYTNLIEDYMDMWDAKNQLTEDIKKRGSKVEVLSASGVPNIKTNDSVLDRLKVNAQMLKILDSLGIKPAQADAGDEDDEM